MAYSYYLHILCLFSTVLTLGLSISSYAKEEDRQVYIVYMGGLSHGEKFSVTSNHMNMLQQVVDDSFVHQSLVRSYTRSFNAFAANLTHAEKEKLSGFGEVVSIFPNRRLRLQTTRSWDFMGLHENARREHQRESDIIVGVIDGGIWPESASFDDQGFGPPPKKWKGECKGGQNFTCNRKLIGARYYSAVSARDTDGHGTHTASTAVGRNVKHANFYGLGQGTARGGAPSARVAVYAVFCFISCSDHDILAAFDDATADGVDIISISIAGSEPMDFTSDTIAIGAFHALERGILTVQGAGNNGPKPGGIPSVVPWVFSIGASSTDRLFVDKVALGNGQVLTGSAIDTFKRHEVSFPLVYGKDASSNCSETESQQCAEGCLNATLVNKKIVVCNTLTDDDEAYQAGAVGVIMNNTKLSPPNVVPLPESWLMPSEFARLLNYIGSTKHAGQTPKAYISATETIRDHRAPRVAIYSARGPNSIFPDILKPDVTAPGTDILAAYSPEGYTSSSDRRPVNFTIASGTSISCPHVSGAAAYVKSFHPDWSPSAIKSALMTTARRLKDKKTDTAEFSHGAGHIDPVKALNPGLVYDISTHDYITYLCDLGYNTSTVRKITEDSSSCPGDSKTKTTKHDKLNYPTMTAKVKRDKTFQVKFFRTVTNVGHANSRYRSKIVKRSGDGHVVVRPRVLKFRALNERKSFVVTVSGKISEETITASIVWSDGRHKVRSPIVVYDDSAFGST